MVVGIGIPVAFLRYVTTMAILNITWVWHMIFPIKKKLENKLERANNQIRILSNIPQNSISEKFITIVDNLEFAKTEKDPEKMRKLIDNMYNVVVMI